MRFSLIVLLSLALPALAYDGEEYPEMYDNQGEVYQEESYPEETYQEETYQEETYQQDTYQEESYQEPAAAQEPAYQDPADAAQMQEVRNMCQEYAADMPPEEQSAYIEDCLRSQGY